MTKEQKERKAARAKAYRARPEIKARENALRNARRRSPKYREKARKRKRKRIHATLVVRQARVSARRRGQPLVSIERPTRPVPVGCEICGQNNTNRALHFDHCHTTGRFRGWLCHHCNTGLGAARDNPDILRRMIAYLEA